MHRLYIYRVTSKMKFKVDGSKTKKPEKFIKIGLTSQSKIIDRFQKYPDGMVENYTLSLLSSQQFPDRKTLLEAEQLLHKFLKKYSYKPKFHFSGYTECYISTPESKKEIKKALWNIRLTYTPNTSRVKQRLTQSKKSKKTKILNEHKEFLKQIK